MENDEACLSNTGNYTVFKYGNYMIRFWHRILWNGIRK